MRAARGQVDLKPMTPPVAKSHLHDVAISPSVRSQRRTSGVVAGLTLVNIFGSATGFITGPLLARALGAAGRGDLAAVTVPLGLAPGLLGLGIASFAFRTVPRGRRLGDVIGSLGVPLLVLGVAAAVAGIPISALLAGGHRPTVRICLLIVFCSTPLLLLGSLLQNCLAARRQWLRLMVFNFIPFGVALAGIVTMYLIGDLTVETAALATIAGSLLTLVPALPVLISERPRFDSNLAREGVRFGVKSWLGGLAQVANARLDQLLMISAVAPRVLGLYAVATTISGASGLLGGALSPPLMARIAGGESQLMAQATRIMLLASIVIGLALAAVTPLLLRLFGPQFARAYPMALILFVAQVPQIAAGVLSAALQADGAPMIPTLGEALALVITIAGLAVLLGPLGGIGAAIVSLAAYITSFAFQVVQAHRRLGMPIRAFLIPNAVDIVWIRARMTGLLPGHA